MKKNALRMLVLVLLAGCAPLERVIPEVLPTARYCHEVAYHRSGDAVSFAAQCTAPFGGM